MFVRVNCGKIVNKNLQLNMCYCFEQASVRTILCFASTIRKAQQLFIPTWYIDIHSYMVYHVAIKATLFIDGRSSDSFHMKDHSMLKNIFASFLDGNALELNSRNLWNVAFYSCHIQVNNALWMCQPKSIQPFNHFYSIIKDYVVCTHNVSYLMITCNLYSLLVNSQRVIVALPSCHRCFFLSRKTVDIQKRYKFKSS